MRHHLPPDLAAGKKVVAGDLHFGNGRPRALLKGQLQCYRGGILRDLAQVDLGLQVAFLAIEPGDRIGGGLDLMGIPVAFL
ncbi:MAG: hypothetical protein A2Z88_09740 [Omnitrophica WOR_2 bacterium GWA2_47_8]|nr:MAG: hypothetical protein A2Z88_09740 [Omnitrophica WOR_2 bacterium GWA2_47_8]